jgi:hypothetical protein
VELKTEIMKWQVDSFIGHHLNELIKIKSMSQEEPRHQVSRMFLDTILHVMEDTIHNRSMNLVFNLNEVGISEWEDRKPRKVIILITIESQLVHHTISLHLKHLSIITCIFTGGQCIIHYMVMSQDSKLVRSAVMETGLRIGTYLVLRQRIKPYINAEFFAEYIWIVFHPHLVNACKDPALANEEVLLWMDNCWSHVA